MTHVDTKILKEAVDVMNLLRHYDIQKLERAGEWIKGCCPYHNDSNPSFGMKIGDTSFHCFSCGVSGDAIRLVMDKEGLDFSSAIGRLAELSGFIIDEDSRMAYIRDRWLRDKTQDEKKDTILESRRIYALNDWARSFFEQALQGSVAERYLDSRGFSLADAKHFSLGYYGPNSGFLEKAKQQGFSEGELVMGGFLSTFDGREYERFVNRLMFPIFKDEGRIIAFSGRALLPEEPKKYTATPNSDYYRKGFFIYGLQHIRLNEPVILTEGNLDCVRLVGHGLNAVAQLGTALTTNQCSLLKSLTNSVTLLYDGDRAGLNTTVKNILPLVEAGIEVWVVTLPAGFDPDTFVRDKGLQALKDLLANPASGLRFYINFNKTAGFAETDIIRSCFKAVKGIANENTKLSAVSLLSQILGYSEQTIKAEVKKA